MINWRHSLYLLFENSALMPRKNVENGLRDSCIKMVDKNKRREIMEDGLT